MPVLTSNIEMSDLAKKLAKMRYWRAKWYTYGMDKKAHYDLYRVAVNTSEYHTRLSLPTLGLRVTFVERVDTGTPNNRGLVKTRYRYVEARVEALPKPAPETIEEHYIHLV